MKVSKTRLWVDISLMTLFIQILCILLQSWSNLLPLGCFCPVVFSIHIICSILLANTSSPFNSQHTIILLNTFLNPQAKVKVLFWSSYNNFTIVFAILSWNSFFTYRSLPLDSSHLEKTK